MKQTVELYNRIQELLKPYGQMLYAISVLPVTILMSMGLNSSYFIYKALFGISLLACVLKFCCCKYRIRELLWMAVALLLVSLGYLRTGDKSLFLAFVALVGAKEVDLTRVLKYAFWGKLAATIGTVSFSLLGIRENIIFTQYKFIDSNYVRIDAPSFGYCFPNHAYFNFFSLALLFVVAYFPQMKWYGRQLCLLLITSLMYKAYLLIYCRTGWYGWLLVAVMVEGCLLLRLVKLEKLALYPMAFVYAVISVGMTVLSILFKHVTDINEMTFVVWLNHKLTARLSYSSTILPDALWKFIPEKGVHFQDIAFLHLVVNYGSIFCVLYMVVYIAAGIWFAKRGRIFECVGLAGMALYGTCEMLPLSAAWNILIILVSVVLFESREQESEPAVLADKETPVEGQV